ncbi:MAG TPA: DUF3999 family protein [Silvibacterium sp.]|nr:DUF3999 family protein [Silvibacterium sp.]
MAFHYIALLLFIIAASPVTHFRYDRPVLSSPPQRQQACLVLDPATFSHAGPQLSSLRLYRADAETPYAIDNAIPAESSAKNIAPLNTGVRDDATSFDAAMPDGSYSNLDLKIEAKDFIATVYVSGSQSQKGAATTKLGSYTIFDFTHQKLGRSTVLHLPQSDFRYLHFRIVGPISPDQITGLSTARLSQSHPQYVTVATSSTVQQKGRDTIIEFTVPGDVPVDRILFTPGAQPINFSREVAITVAPVFVRPATDAEEPPRPSFSSGNLLRIHSTENGRKIDEEDLAVAAPDINSSLATKWTVAIHNQDDAPLDLQSVTLQMVARTLCFSADQGASYRLYYGDSALNPPRYDYAALFSREKNAARASLGPEEQNPQYQPPPDMRPFTERHPALLWIALLAAIFTLGVIALRSSRQIQKP